MNRVIKVPIAFLLDHDERGLATPDVVRATSRHFWIDVADPHFAELVSDAEFYAFPGTDDRRMTLAARALLAAIKRATADTLTAPQVLMLRTCVEHPDGSVLSAGFQNARHAAATAKALRDRGLLAYVKSGRGYDVDRITAAGRAALDANNG